MPALYSALSSPKFQERPQSSGLYENGALYVKQGADKAPLPLNRIRRAGDVGITVRRR